MMRGHTIVVVAAAWCWSVACGGDDAVPALVGPQPDAGAQDGSLVRSPSLQLSVDPISVVRGKTTRIVARLVRNDFDGAVTISMRGGHVGLQAPDVIVPASTDTTEIVLDAAESVPYGQYTIQLTATAVSLPDAAIDVPLDVRGPVGALDTSYGTNGLAAQIPNAMIGDAMLDSQGRLVIAGGYDATAQAVLLVRLTPQGQLDPTFAMGGSLRWDAPFSHLAHPEMRAGYYRGGTIERSGGYSLSAYFQDGPTSRTSAVFHSEVSFAGAAPIVIPSMDPPDLGTYAFGSLVVRDVHSGDGGGFFVFRRGHVARYHVDNTPDLDFGVAGKSEAVGDYFVDGVLTRDRLYGVIAKQVAASTVDYRAVTLSHEGQSSGTVLLSGREAEPAASKPVRLSRPNPAGHALAAYGRTLRDLAPDGTQVDLKGTRYQAPLPGTGENMLPFYFPDGNIGALVASSPLLLHVLSPTGEQLTASTGVELEGSDVTGFTSLGIVEAFPDPRGGLLVVYGTEGPSAGWVVRRYFL